ncbi:methionyl-tRNA formyltransferase [Candidatus Peregrinibacteria bacterium RIFCSPLOWO2_02_FULL_48_14]|nr:MAG: methionyl-tRNA formyltransferase [Candidatus Peregrinibacteria bacterium RIFCSPLOWO2_02_FULL_48_14]
MPYTVIFFASSEIALPLLKTMAVDSRFKIKALITQPDKAAGRDGELKKPNVTHDAESLGLRILQPEKLSLEVALFQEIQENPPDFFLTFAYGQLIPESWLALPRIAPINVHPSLLPKYRGPSPIQAAILNEDCETGITLMKMTKEMDSGPIANQEPLNIPNHSTINTLFELLGNLAAEKVPDWTFTLAQKKPEEQFCEQDHSKATFVKKIEKEDGRLDFQKSAEEIFRQFRAFISWPGVFTLFKGKRLKLLELEPSSDVLEPGKVHCDKHSITIGTSDGSLKIKRLQLEGKNALYAEHFILGQPEFCSAELPS